MTYAINFFRTGRVNYFCVNEEDGDVFPSHVFIPGPNNDSITNISYLGRDCLQRNA